MEKLASWPTGWTVVGDADNHTVIGITHGDEPLKYLNTVWDLEPVEDATERATDFAALLEILIGATIVDTDVLTGIAVDVTDSYDWHSTGSVLGLYRLKSEEEGIVYFADASSLESLVRLMSNYTETDSDDNSEQGS